MGRTLKKVVLTLVNRPLWLLSTFVLFIMLSSTLYSAFENKGYGTSLWWTIVTICTVGYGDQFPVTTEGRIVGSFTMLLFIFFLAPCVIGSILSNVMADMHKFTDEEQKILFGEVKTMIGKMNQIIGEVDDVEEEDAESESREQWTVRVLVMMCQKMGIEVIPPKGSCMVDEGSSETTM